MPLPRIVTAGPRAALAAVERLSPVPSANARTAAAAISTSVSDRRRLDPDAADDGPGALRG
jgi:hypothetical protein